MARVAIPLNTLPFQGGDDALTMVSADDTNEHYFVNDGNTLLLIINKSSPSVTLTGAVVSVDDPFGRAEDVSINVASGASAEYGPFIPAIWNQGGGNQINVDVGQTDANIFLAAVKFSPIR